MADRDLRKFAVSSFSGGLDVRTSPQTLASTPRYRNRLTLARGVAYFKTGGVSKRLDVATYNSSTIGASVAITGGFQLRLDNGTDLIIAGTDDGRVVKFASDGTTSNLTTGKTSGARWHFDKFANFATISNRLDAPMKYDGTTFGTLGGSPPSTGGPHVTHGNRTLFLDATNVRRLTWSALGDSEDFTSASNAGNVTVTGPNASPLVFLLSMTGELLLGHRDLITRLQGTSPSTYAITNALPAKVSAGGISPQGAAFGNNDAYWISGRGIHSLATTQRFGDLVESFASERIDPYFTANTDFTLSLNQLDKSVSCYDSQNNRLLFGVDTDGDGKNDTILVRDVYTGAWSVWPSMSCASLWTGYNGTRGVDVFMGGYDGFVRRLNVSASTNAIDARFNHISDLGGPHIAKSLRHLYVYLGEEGAGTVTVTTNIDFGASGGQTYSVSLLGDSAVIGSTFIIGTSRLGARSQIIKRLNCSGVGEFWEIGFANQQAGQNFTVFAYEALWRPRRIIGRAPVN